MIRFQQRGDFSKTTRFLDRCEKLNIDELLNRYGEKGVEELAKATPKRTGKTAASWNFKINRDRNGVSIVWSNSNIVNGVPVAIVLQYGHATSAGTYVQGRDYINPALTPVFEELAEALWKEVTAR